MPNCFVCDHPESSHCKSGVTHGRYRIAVGAAQRPADTFTCKTRHCEEPLCSCTCFARTPQDVVWPNRRFA